jgi:hypothetical protein
MAALHAKEWEEARRWGAECGRLYEELGDLLGQSLALFVDYQVARYTGDLAEAARLMRKYVAEADNFDSATSSSGLELMAEVELLEGRIDRAVKMRAASEALREEYGGGTPPPLIDLTDIKRAAVERLGEETAERLWQEGQSMSLDEAVAYVLKDPAS